MSVETLHEMESHRVQTTGKGSQGEVCKSDSADAKSGPVTDEEDRYIAVEEKPCTFLGTFSDSEDELDTKFV